MPSSDNIMGRYYYYSHFTDKESKGQRLRNMYVYLLNEGISLE